MAENTMNTEAAPEFRVPELRKREWLYRLFTAFKLRVPYERRHDLLRHMTPILHSVVDAVERTNNCSVILDMIEYFTYAPLEEKERICTGEIALLGAIGNFLQQYENYYNASRQTRFTRSPTRGRGGGGYRRGGRPQYRSHPYRGGCRDESRGDRDTRDESRDYQPLTRSDYARSDHRSDDRDRDHADRHRSHSSRPRSPRNHHHQSPLPPAIAAELDGQSSMTTA